MAIDYLFKNDYQKEYNTYLKLTRQFKAEFTEDQTQEYIEKFCDTMKIPIDKFQRDLKQKTETRKQAYEELSLQEQKYIKDFSKNEIQTYTKDLFVNEYNQVYLKYRIQEYNEINNESKIDLPNSQYKKLMILIIIPFTIMIFSIVAYFCY